VERECRSKMLFDYLEGGETLEDFGKGFLPYRVNQPLPHSKNEAPLACGPLNAHSDRRMYRCQAED
jgi:hypothetical protein